MHKATHFHPHRTAHEVWSSGKRADLSRCRPPGPPSSMSAAARWEGVGCALRGHPTPVRSIDTRRGSQGHGSRSMPVSEGSAQEERVMCQRSHTLGPVRRWLPNPCVAWLPRVSRSLAFALTWQNASPTSAKRDMAHSSYLVRLNYLLLQLLQTVQAATVVATVVNIVGLLFLSA